MFITTFRDIKNPFGIREACKFNELSYYVDSLITSTILFHDNKRHKSKFEMCHYLQVESDGCDVENVKDTFKHFNILIVGSKSHMEEKNGAVEPRIHMYIELDKPIGNVREYETFMNRFHQKYPYFDTAAKDAARVFFPATKGILFEQYDKAPLSWRDFLVEDVIIQPKVEKEVGNRNNALYQIACETSKGFSINLTATDTSEVMIAKIKNHVLRTHPEFCDLPENEVIATITSAYQRYSTFTYVHKNGCIMKDPRNIENWVKTLEEMGNYFYMDDASGQIYLNKKILLDDFILKNITFSEFVKYGMTRDKEMAILAIETMARRNSFFPFRDWVESKKWDGKDRLAQLTDTIHNDKEDISDIKNILVVWMMKLIKAQYGVYSDDCFTFMGEKLQNGVLCFQGSQGIGKSEWFYDLFGGNMRFYLETKADVVNMGFKLKCVSRACVQLSEMEGITRKNDASKLKDYLTNDVISIRKPYDKFVSYYPQRTAFCAAVNSTDFLVDTTGNRRFWIIPITKLDWLSKQDWFNAQQIWAQIHSMVFTGVTDVIPEKVRKALDDVMSGKSETLSKLSKTAEQFEQVDPLVAGVMRKFKKGDRFYITSDIMQICHPHPHTCNNTFYKQFKREMSKAGYEEIRRGSGRGYKVQMKTLDELKMEDEE